MTVVLSEMKLAQFEQLFANPSIEEMLQLAPDDFEHFVSYVFASAGYRVEHVGDQHFPNGPGVDLNLYTTQEGKRPVARVEVRRYDPGNLLNFNHVMAFGGKLRINGDIPGYLVTTSGFNPNAKTAAEATNNKIRLVDGAHLLRYIRYLQGSRIQDVTGFRRTIAPIPPDWLSPSLRPSLRAPRDTTVVAVANNKGGVAKTTTALNLGLALAERGARVLLVDLDGQASLTSALPLPDPRQKPPRNAPPPQRDHFITEYFGDQTHSMANLVQPTRFERVWLLPAHEELHRMDSGGTARPELELAFVRAVHDPSLEVPPHLPNSGPFNWIIFDTPPAQTLYTRLALAASHYVLIPLLVETFAIRGINRILATADAMRALVGDTAAIAGCLITRWKSSTSTKIELPKLRDELASRQLRLFVNAIPYDDRIEQAHLNTSGGGIKAVLGFGTSDAAARYRDALDEFLKEARPHVHNPDK